MDCPRFQRWARVCLNVFVEGDPHRFDRDQSKAKPGGGEKEGANPASLRGILAVVGGGCIQRAEELGQPSPSCENLFLKVHMIGGSHDQVGRCWLCFDCCNIGAGHVARAAFISRRARSLKSVTRAARVCTWSMGTAGRLSCAAKPGGVWCGVQGMFVASGVETLAPKISMR